MGMRRWEQCLRGRKVPRGGPVEKGTGSRNAELERRRGRGRVHDIAHGWIGGWTEDGWSAGVGGAGRWWPGWSAGTYGTDRRAGRISPGNRGRRGSNDEKCDFWCARSDIGDFPSIYTGYRRDVQIRHSRAIVERCKPCRWLIWMEETEYAFGSCHCSVPGLGVRRDCLIMPPKSEPVGRPSI